MCGLNGIERRAVRWVMELATACVRLAKPTVSRDLQLQSYDPHSPPETRSCLQSPD